MRYTLENFYQSREWTALMQVIKAERTNADGYIICAHCGRPIVKMYDCIGHHKIHLTEDNVNDYEVSLNPDNVELVHHVCHNRIHNKFGHPRQEIYLVYGAPLSGKSTYVDSVVQAGDLVVDMDSIWQCVSGMDRYVKPKRLNAVVFGMRDYLMECVRYHRGKWQSAYIVGGYPLISERERLCRELGAQEIFIDTDMDACMERLLLCEDGRDKSEWEKYIAEWFRRYTPGTP